MSSTTRTEKVLPVADRTREAMSALAVNENQFAEFLRASRPTVNSWFDGKVPNPANAQRLTRLLDLLTTAGVTTEAPLSRRFLHHPLHEGGVSLLAALSAEPVDEALVATLFREAKRRGDEAVSRRVTREDRLRALGFEDPSDKQRREQLAQSVAMRGWPTR